MGIFHQFFYVDCSFFCSEPEVLLIALIYSYEYHKTLEAVPLKTVRDLVLNECSTDILRDHNTFKITYYKTSSSKFNLKRVNVAFSPRILNICLRNVD